MSSKTQPAGKILGRLKGLRNHMQADEVPFFTVPAIWDGGQGQRNMPCDVVLTNQRLFGYVYVSFPRERLFLVCSTTFGHRAICAQCSTCS